MTKMTIRIALLTILFSALLLALACQGPQNTNQNANKSNSATNSNSNPAVSLAADCSGNTADKIKKVRDGVKKNIDDDGKLSQQHAAGWFTFIVAEDPISRQIVMTFSGRIGGENEMKDLVATANGYMKKGCVDRVTFGSTRAAAVADGFEWSACDYPTRPCPNGECREVCPTIQPTPNSNTGSNSGNKNGN